MAKHNKKRNTAFIYEVLLREVVKQTINKKKKKRDAAISIIKQHFKKNTLLRKELEYYKTLSETKGLNERIAEKLIYETIKQQKQIDKKKLFQEQSHIISIINKQLSKNAFNNFVPNYKNLATIAQMFNDDLTPKTKVLLESKLIQTISTSLQKGQKGFPNVSGLVVKKFINRFNETYTELLSEQKDLLSKYVSSFQDEGVEFKFFINEEIDRLKAIVSDAHQLDTIKEDAVLQQKLNEVAELLTDFNKLPLNKEKILQVLKIQNLAKEIQSSD